MKWVNINLVFIFLFSCLPCFGQLDCKRTLIASGLSFFSGASWATNQVLEHKNYQFQNKFPNTNPKFWGDESWKNKYIDFDPSKGRNNIPVWFTDGKHLTASISHSLIFMTGITITIGEKRKIKYYLIDAAASFLCFSAGNELTWLYFKS